jgi:hypothetical protein
MWVLLLWAAVVNAYTIKQISPNRVDIVTSLYPDIESCHCYTNCSASLSADHRSIYISNGNWTRLVVSATFRHPDGRSEAMSTKFDIYRQPNLEPTLEPILTPLERRWYTIALFVFAACATILAIWWQIGTKNERVEYVSSKRRDKELAAADLDMY